jgi:hypothetical protein
MFRQEGLYPVYALCDPFGSLLKSTSTCRQFLLVEGIYEKLSEMSYLLVDFGLRIGALPGVGWLRACASIWELHRLRQAS